MRIHLLTFFLGLIVDGVNAIGRLLRRRRRNRNRGRLLDGRCREIFNANFSGDYVRVGARRWQRCDTFGHYDDAIFWARAKVRKICRAKWKRFQHVKIIQIRWIFTLRSSQRTRLSHNARRNPIKSPFKISPQIQHQKKNPQILRRAIFKTSGLVKRWTTNEFCAIV